MKAIVSDKITLERINKKINDYMIETISEYKGKQWGDIIKHPTKNLYALTLNDDVRNPFTKLTSNEKMMIKNISKSEWIPKSIQ